MTKFGLPKSRRLRSAREFATVYELRQRTGDQHLLVFGAANSLGETRFGLSVSKKNGNAVRRARIKRLLREAFRLSQHQLPSGLDLILIPRPNSGAGVDDYRESLKRLSRRLARNIGVEKQP